MWAFLVLLQSLLAAVSGSSGAAQVWAESTGRNQTSKLTAVAGTLAMTVSRWSRRLQTNDTGFSSDGHAQRAIKQTIAYIAGTTSDKVKLHSIGATSGGPTASSSPAFGRRLITTEDIGTGYMVQARNGSDAQRMLVSLQSFRLPLLGESFANVLRGSGVSAFVVMVTSHKVALASQEEFDAFTDDEAAGMFLARNDIPACATLGVALNDPQRNETPNGGYPASAVLCQLLCQNSVYCEHFTYYNNTLGCWLQGSRSIKFYPEMPVVSGPARCEGSSQSGRKVNRVDTGASGDNERHHEENEAIPEVGAKASENSGEGGVLPNRTSSGDVITQTRTTSLELPSSTAVIDKNHPGLRAEASSVQHSTTTSKLDAREFEALPEAEQGGIPLWVYTLLPILLLLAGGIGCCVFLSGRRTSEGKQIKLPPDASADLERLPLTSRERESMAAPEFLTPMFSPVSSSDPTSGEAIPLQLVTTPVFQPSRK